MIHRTDTVFQPEQTPKWRTELANAISNPVELLHMLNLQESSLSQQLDASPDFRLRVPQGFVAKMKTGDPDDPLLKQVLPLTEEIKQQAGFVTDPVGDLASEVVPGVLHKYQGRALLVTTGACGIHCRYCFRRHFPYGDSNPSAGQWKAALDYITKTISINEVLLSGGDPLTLTDQKLSKLVTQIENIPHVKRLRIHTRMPVILPDRIDERLLDWISRTRLKTVVVIHANHVNEIDDKVCKALDGLSKENVLLLNQSVLLQGVNDTVDSLVALSEKLFHAGVLPYYIHLLDPVQGAAHFDVKKESAIKLMEKVRNQLPGYLVPKLVWEKPGAGSKITLL